MIISGFGSVDEFTAVHVACFKQAVVDSVGGEIDQSQVEITGLELSAWRALTSTTSTPSTPALGHTAEEGGQQEQEEEGVEFGQREQEQKWRWWQQKPEQEDQGQEGQGEEGAYNFEVGRRRTERRKGRIRQVRGRGRRDEGGGSERREEGGSSERREEGGGGDSLLRYDTVVSVGQNFFRRRLDRRRLGSDGVTVDYSIIGLSSAEAETAQSNIASIASSPATFSSSLSAILVSTGTAVPADFGVTASVATVATVEATAAPTTAPTRTSPQRSPVISKGPSAGLRSSRFAMAAQTALVFALAAGLQVAGGTGGT
jgi:hypothetical protein